MLAIKVVKIDLKIIILLPPSISSKQNTSSIEIEKSTYSSQGQGQKLKTQTQTCIDYNTRRALNKVCVWFASMSYTKKRRASILNFRMNFRKSFSFKLKRCFMVSIFGFAHKMIHSYPSGHNFFRLKLLLPVLCIFPSLRMKVKI